MTFSDLFLWLNFLICSLLQLFMGISLSHITAEQFVLRCLEQGGSVAR